MMKISLVIKGIKKTFFNFLTFYESQLNTGTTGDGHLSRQRKKQMALRVR